MPIWRGTHYSRVFNFTDSVGPIDITGWEFMSEFRGSRNDPDPPLLTVVSGSLGETGWVIEDAPTGKLRLNIGHDDTELLTTSKIIFDVLRTDIVPGPVYLFEATVPVKDPVTRV
jgi:hypothetical protein